MAKDPFEGGKKSKTDESSLEKLEDGGYEGDAEDSGRATPDRFPEMDAALPGRRMAHRIENMYPKAPPGGGEGDGLKDRPIPPVPGKGGVVSDFES